MFVNNAVAILLYISSFTHAVRVAGPIVTVTLKDPYVVPTTQPLDNVSDADDGVIEKVLSSSTSTFSSLSLLSLNPDVAYSIRSNDGGPLPKLLPSLKMLSATAYYKYNLMRKSPHAVSFYAGLRLRPFQLPKKLPRMSRSLIDSFEKDPSQQQPSTSSPSLSDLPDLTEDLDDHALNLSFSPTFSLKSRTASGELKVWGDDIKRWIGTARFNIPYPFSTKTTKQRLLSFASATFKIFLPFTALNSLTITPSYDTYNSLYPFSCQVTAESGAGKTSAVLNLNLDDPTFSLIHQLDDRNTIAPEISLHTAKILYNWTTQLSSGMLRTRVDPTSAIQVTWIDKAGSGRWVTDFKLPLEGSAGPLAADIRVQRQFAF